IVSNRLFVFSLPFLLQTLSPSSLSLHPNAIPFRTLFTDVCSCFVRARRLNVIIQPHLRFVYELLKWDEVLQRKRGGKVKRELEWAEICREITAMNRPYARG